MAKYKKTKSGARVKAGGAGSGGKVLSAIIWLLIGTILSIGIVVGTYYLTGILPKQSEVTAVPAIYFDHYNIVF